MVSWEANKKMMEELQQLKKDHGAAAKVNRKLALQTPPPTIKAPSPSKPASHAPSPDTSSKGSTTSAEQPQQVVEPSEGARLQRLRRLCEVKPSGKCHVTPEIHQKWKTGTKEDREALADELESAGWAKDQTEQI